MDWGNRQRVKIYLQRSGKEMDLGRSEVITGEQPKQQNGNPGTVDKGPGGEMRLEHLLGKD